VIIGSSAQFSTYSRLSALPSQNRNFSGLLLIHVELFNSNSCSEQFLYEEKNWWPSYWLWIFAAIAMSVGVVTAISIVLETIYRLRTSFLSITICTQSLVELTKL